MKELKVKSVAVWIPGDRVHTSLLEMGFSLVDTVTTVSDGRFWIKMLFVRGEERVSVSEEIGDVYPKDPVITICGFSGTIEKIMGVLD
ncbi:MAG: hypothetical protein QXU32_09335 [Nitrososphaerales archaeon]